MRDSSEITNHILKSATAEFLDKGFEKASMRVIAKRAGVTTGAMYARYPNKDKVFGELVEPVIAEFMSATAEGNAISQEQIDNDNVVEMWAGTKYSSTEIMKLIYKNKTIFSLLINCSNGSSYENFIERIVESEEKEVRTVLECFQQKGYACIEVSEQVIHMLISAHCHALFEIVRHDLSQEDGFEQVNQINDFFICGWNKIFGL